MGAWNVRRAYRGLEKKEEGQDFIKPRLGLTVPCAAEPLRWREGQRPQQDKAKASRSNPSRSGAWGSRLEPRV